MSKDAKTEEKLHGAPAVRREIYDWVETFCTALFAVVLIFTFAVRFVTVDGESMMNTLHDHDRLIITSTPYTPKRGDIVVVHDLEERGFYGTFSGPIIKRVIATEGETVSIDYENWQVTVTGVDGSKTVLDESEYVNFQEFARIPSPEVYPDSLQPLTEHTVAKGCVFVCGDNRNNSLDSRYVGDIDKRKILGKVLVRLMCGSKEAMQAHGKNPFWDFGIVHGINGK